RTLAKADDREVRKPVPRLRLVDTEALQPSVRDLGDPGRTPLLVVEDEHPDRARFPVPRRCEDRPGDTVDGFPQSAGDGLDLARRPRTEEGDCDVQVLDGNDPDALHGQLLVLPRADGPSCRVGQPEAEKEAET